MGLFNRSIDNTTVTNNEHDEKAELEKLRTQYQEYIHGLDEINTVSVYVKGELFDTGSKYRMYETENEFVFFPMLISKGVIEYDCEIYKRALSLPKVVITKNEYTCTLDDNIRSQEKINYYTQSYAVESIKIVFTSETQNFIVIIVNHRQNLLPIINLVNSLHIKNLFNLIDIPIDSFVVETVEDNSILKEHKYVFFRTEKAVFL